MRVRRSLALLPAVVLMVFLLHDPGWAHERKEVAGLVVVFGAEPEPALTGEMQFLRWRFRDQDGEEPYDRIQDAEAVVVRDGREFGPFPVRGSRGDPGTYQTRHIFTETGTYSVRLDFRKGEDATVHSVDFEFDIADRGRLEIPGDVAEADAVTATLERYAAAVRAMDVEAMGELVTDDLLIFEGAGVDRGWAEYRDHHLRPELEAFDSIDYRFEEIETHPAGGLAWASFRYSLHIVMPEREIESGGVATAVLVRGSDGAWRLRHLHTTPERRP